MSGEDALWLRVFDGHELTEFFGAELHAENLLSPIKGLGPRETYGFELAAGDASTWGQSSVDEFAGDDGEFFRRSPSVHEFGCCVLFNIGLRNRAITL